MVPNIELLIPSQLLGVLHDSKTITCWKTGPKRLSLHQAVYMGVFMVCKELNAGPYACWSRTLPLNWIPGPSLALIIRKQIQSIKRRTPCDLTILEGSPTKTFTLPVIEFLYLNFRGTHSNHSMCQLRLLAMDWA